MYKLGFLVLLATSMSLLRCNGGEEAIKAGNVGNQAAIMEKQVDAVSRSLVTFIELGSVKCIPCQKMQPVMKNIEAKYQSQIDVIFYDVWQKDQKIKAKKYGIRLIPTQVFLDAEGIEIFRHEGFFPEEEIDKFLDSRGLKVKSEM